MTNLNLETTNLILAGVVVFSMLVQAIVLLALFLVFRKSINKLQEELEETRTKVTGLIDTVQPVFERASEFFVHTGPKIESTVTDLAAIAQKLRAETNDVQAAATELIERLRRQGARMDSMMTKTLDTVDRAASFMTETISKPMRQLSAVLASAKAVVETLRTGAPESRPEPEHLQDNPDYFG